MSPKTLLSELSDEAATRRVLKWVLDKYSPSSELAVTQQSPQIRKSASTSDTPEGESSLADREIPGVALISDSGEFRLTVRDPKAKNTNDAAIRLTLVTIFAYCELSREKSVSSKQIVKPMLEHWRAYTGNTRRALAQHRGVIRNGDALSLDHHARVEAERYVDEILDDEIKGTWTPTGKRSGRSSNGTKTTEAAEV